MDRTQTILNKRKNYERQGNVRGDFQKPYEEIAKKLGVFTTAPS